MPLSTLPAPASSHKYFQGDGQNRFLGSFLASGGLQDLSELPGCWLNGIWVPVAGAIGGRSLEYLRLDAVLRPAGRMMDLLQGRWFGMWS